MVEAAGEALSLILTWHGLALLVLATVIGTVVAIVPGLGSPIALAVLLPVTFTMSPEEALLFLVPIIGAGGFAGSMTAILVGVPGDETNAATVLDGHALARQGRAGEAIGASATASALGAVIGVLVLVASIPLIRGVILRVGPAEIFAFATVGLLMVGMVSARKERFKGVVAGFFGVSLGLIGFNYALGGVRFTMGIDQFVQGIPLVPALVGLFAVPEAIAMIRDPRPIGGMDVVRGGVLTGVKQVLTRPRLLLQSSLLGTGIGIVPGVGGSVACWVSYFIAKATSKEPEQFGRGSIEGVIGPEATIDAKDGGQLMPLLALGLPGGITTAILAGAFLFHGIQPGASMFTSNLDLVYLMVFGLIFSNVSTSILGLSMANIMLKVTTVPPYIVAPIVVALGAVGSYVATTSFYGPLVFLVFGGVGYLIVRGGYSRAAIVVGLILLPIIEVNLHVARQSARGSWNFLFRPITLTILILGLAALAVPPLVRAIRKRRGNQISGLERLLESEEMIEEAASLSEGGQNSTYSATIDLVFAVLATAWGAVMLFHTFSLPGDQRLVPMLVLPVLVATGIAAIINALRAGQQSSQAIRPGRRDALSGLALLVLVFLIWTIGLFPAVFVWTTSVMVAFGIQQRRSRLQIAGSIVVGLGVAIGLYYLVGVVLNVRLPDPLLY